MDCTTSLLPPCHPYRPSSCTNVSSNSVTSVCATTPTLEIEYYSTPTPSHLLYLIHSLLQADGNFQMNGKAVSWECILHLGALQEKEVCQAGANRQEQRIWGNGITQVFSTVQVLHFAARLGLPQFHGHEATIFFIELRVLFF
ncbi:hypothetical protein E2320_021262 [Naja naja]|nr:hypothetical protein E2320_021262 [Naja naja]